MYIFYHSGFLSNLNLPWETVFLKIFTVLKYFYLSGFLSNLRLPWKHSVPWIHSIEIFFSIQDFRASCPCPEKRVCPEIFQATWAAGPPSYAYGGGSSTDSFWSAVWNQSTESRRVKTTKLFRHRKRSDHKLLKRKWVFLRIQRRGQI